jgi:hypothetical protein
MPNLMLCPILGDGLAGISKIRNEQITVHSFSLTSNFLSIIESPLIIEELIPNGLSTECVWFSWPANHACQFKQYISGLTGFCFYLRLLHAALAGQSLSDNSFCKVLHHMKTVFAIC